MGAGAVAGLPWFVEGWARVQRPLLVALAVLASPWQQVEGWAQVQCPFAVSLCYEDVLVSLVVDSSPWFRAASALVVMGGVSVSWPNQQWHSVAQHNFSGIDRASL